MGVLKGYMECHIGGRNSDWVLIYHKKDDDILELIRTGSHSELFD